MVQPLPEQGPTTTELPPGFTAATANTTDHIPSSVRTRQELRERLQGILRDARHKSKTPAETWAPPPKPKTLRLGNTTIAVVDISQIEDNDPDTHYFSMWVTPRTDSSTAYVAHVSDQHTEPGLTAPNWDNLPKEYHDLKEAFILKAERLPPHSHQDQKIDLIDGKTPPFGPLYNLSTEELQILHNYIQDMVAKGLIRPSTAPCGAPVLFARKKDGSLRLCVDYRRLNAITLKNVYPLPLIPEMLDRLAGSKIYSKLDLKDAYWHLRIAAGDEWKTAFRTRYGLYEYLIMPFGLSNAPGNFQTHVNNLFSDMLDVFLTIYLDDFMIYSQTYEEHVQHVRRILRRIIDNGLTVNLKKSDFHTTHTTFLGYDIFTTGISMSEDRLRSIVDWESPKDVSALRSFLGVANFYRGFIPFYSDLFVCLFICKKRFYPNMGHKRIVRQPSPCPDSHGAC